MVMNEPRRKVWMNNMLQLQLHVVLLVVVRAAAAAAIVIIGIIIVAMIDGHHCRVDDWHID